MALVFYIKYCPVGWYGLSRSTNWRCDPNFVPINREQWSFLPVLSLFRSHSPTKKLFLSWRPRKCYWIRCEELQYYCFAFIYQLWNLGIWNYLWHANLIEMFWIFLDICVCMCVCFLQLHGLECCFSMVLFSSFESWKF